MQDLLSFVVTEPSRRAIIQELQNGPRSVSQIVTSTGLKQPNVSNHLARMRRLGVVAAERTGREVHYRLAAQYAYILAGLRGVNSASSGDTLAQTASEVDLEELSHNYLAAIVDGKDGLAESLVIGLYGFGADIITIYSGVIEPAMVALGERYAEGSVSIACEHRATAITNRIMARLVRFASPSEAHVRSAVVGCVQGNRHAVGAQMVADALTVRGWTVHYLDGDVPIDDFVSMVLSVLPDIVAVSCSSEDDVLTARDLMRRLRIATPATLCIGGRAFQRYPALAAALIHDIYAPDIVSFLAKLDDRFPA